MNANPDCNWPMAEKMKRSEITAAKIAARAEITQLLEQLRAVSKIPGRIVNGDAMAASEFKDLLEDAYKKKQCTYQHGSLADLTARIASLHALHRSIT